MELGPTQMLAIGFEDGAFEGGALAELCRLRRHDSVRLVGLLVVHRNEDGTVETLEQRDLTPEEAAQLGALAGALLGLETDEEKERAEEGGAAEPGAAAWAWGLGDEQVWCLADYIPPGTTTIALIEHRWAIPLRDAIEASGGVTLVDAWIHPEDLAAIGAMASGP